MWCVHYCPSDRMEIMLRRWFDSEEAARKYASMWTVFVIYNPTGRPVL
jgi:hypothetical protein